MKSCNAPEFMLTSDEVYWVDTPARSATDITEGSTYSIGDLARKFKVSLRTLRFYESRGMLSPGREGRRRRYGPEDVDRLSVILKAKKLGFTLNEIRQMTAAEGGEAARHALRLSREKCLEQIAVFERKLAEVEEALAELRWIYASLSERMAAVKPAAGEAIA